MLTKSIYQHLTFTTSVLFFIFSIIQLSYRSRLQLNYFLAGLFSLAGYVFLYFWAYSTGILEYLPFLIHTEISFTLLIGPFSLFYFSAITGNSRYTPYRILIHCVPFALSLPFITTLNLTDPSILTNYIHNPGFLPDYQYNEYISTASSISDFSFTCYSIFSLRKVSLLFKIKSRPELKGVYFFLILLFITVLLIYIAGILDNTALFLAGIGICPLIVVCFIIFSFRYPEYTMKVIKGSRREE
jgi:hypothetical protein